jgi:HicB family
MAIKCKRIIDGKTYNTETATEIEGWDISEEEYPVTHGQHLYQNRFGAFFLHSYQDDGPNGPEENLEPYTPEQARKWLEEHRSYRVDLIESLFGKMPEAGSGESKFTLRMPDSLRDRLAERAKAKNQSLNAWIVRCLESCAAEASSDAEASGRPDIPPMGNMVGSNRAGWRTGGT